MSWIPNNITDCIIMAIIALDKGKLVLGDLTTDFPHDGNKNDYIQAWSFEYGRITTYMDIAFDYMAEASQMLDKAKEIDGGGSDG